MDEMFWFGPSFPAAALVCEGSFACPYTAESSSRLMHRFCSLLTIMTVLLDIGVILFSCLCLSVGLELVSQRVKVKPSPFIGL